MDSEDYSEICTVCEQTFDECKKKCKVCKLPLHIRKEIDVEFLEKGASTRLVEKWIKQEFNLEIPHLELFEHVQHSHLEFKIP